MFILLIFVFREWPGVQFSVISLTQSRGLQWFQMITVDYSWLQYSHENKRWDHCHNTFWKQNFFNTSSCSKISTLLSTMCDDILITHVDGRRISLNTLVLVNTLTSSHPALNTCSLSCWHSYQLPAPPEPLLSILYWTSHRFPRVY